MLAEGTIGGADNWSCRRVLHEAERISWVQEPYTLPYPPNTASLPDKLSLKGWSDCSDLTIDFEKQCDG